MINKKLDDIIKDIEEIKKVFNSTDYFKKLEEVIDKQNNHNKELELKINNLQSKIDKAIEWIEQYEKQIGETSKSIVLTDDVVIGNLLDVLKEDK